jgi:hypothetical protein
VRFSLSTRDAKTQAKACGYQKIRQSATRKEL